MGSVLTPGLQVKRGARITRLRELPARGEILVSVGDAVTGEQIVARAEQQGELRILRVPEALGIESFEVIKGLKVKVGERVAREQILCEHAGLFGLFKSVYKSPEEGILEMVSESTGHLGIRLAPMTISLSAYIGGRIVAVQEKRAVTIETDAVFVQGIFGVGGERQGRIRNLPIAPGELLTEKLIPYDIRGAILVGGTRPDLAALRKAEAAGAVGMVIGAIDDRALAAYLGYDLGIALTGDEEIGMTIIVTEGFGQLPVAERVLTLMKECEGREASINGATQVRAGALRPEIIVPHPLAAQESVTTITGGGLTIGAKIRVIRVPYFGCEAEVVELPHEMERIETGAEARVLRARMSGGEIVTVPRANVELL
jgi:hypothetical protein